jgi:hypothetical protein
LASGHDNTVVEGIKMATPISNISGVNNFNTDQISRVGGPEAREPVKGPSFIGVLKDIAKADVNTKEVVNTYLVLSGGNIDGLDSISSKDYKGPDAVGKIVNALSEQPFMKIEPNKDLPKYLRTGGVDSVA